jgi:uncharacterized membrane protein
MIKDYNQVAGKNLPSLISLSNNIFAFAMTVLVLEVHVPPHDAIHSEQDLLAALYALFPHVVTWLMSLLTLGIYWVVQQTQFSHLQRSNRHFAWIQLGFLAMVTAIPFSTRLLTEFITYRLALLVYWVNILMLGFLVLASWSYACKAQLVKKDVPKNAYEAVRRRILTAQSLYAFGMCLCFFNTYWSIGFIMLTQLNYALAPRIRWLSKLTT